MQVVAAPGNYGTSTTYTILNATGGVTGAYSEREQQLRLPHAVAQLQRQQRVPDPGLQGNAFSGFGGNTVNQRAVGYALDQPSPMPPATSPR